MSFSNGKVNLSLECPRCSKCNGRMGGMGRMIASHALRDLSLDVV